MVPWDGGVCGEWSALPCLGALHLLRSGLCEGHALVRGTVGVRLLKMILLGERLRAMRFLLVGLRAVREPELVLNS